jgi:hypothetical protein
MEFVKSLFMANAKMGHRVLTLMINLKLKHVKNLKTIVPALMGKGAILVMILKYAKISLNKNVQEEIIAHTDMYIKVAPTLTWDSV